MNIAIDKILLNKLLLH